MDNRRDEETETPIENVTIYDDINNYNYCQWLVYDFEKYENKRYDAFIKRENSRIHMDVFRNLKIYVEEMIDYVRDKMMDLLNVYRTPPRLLQFQTDMFNNGSDESTEVLHLMDNYFSLIDNYIPSNHDSGFGRRLWY